MANTNAAFGFKCISPTIKLWFDVDASNSNALFQGDLIIPEDDGYVGQAAAASTQILGSAEAFRNSSDEVIKYLPASTAGSVLVALAGEKVIFIAQDDGVGTAYAKTHDGTNCDIILTHAGSTVTGISGMEIDISDTQTTTAQVRLIRPHPSPGNAYGANCIIECVIVERFYGAATGV